MPTSFTKNRDRLLTSADRRGLLRRHPLPGRGAQAALPRALQRRRHAHRGGRRAQEPAAPRRGRGRGAAEPAAGATQSVDLRGERRGNESAPLDAPTPRPASRARATAGRPGSATPATALIENRNGLIVEAELTQASGTAEREAGLRLLARQRRRRGRGRMSVAADKGYDSADFVAGRASCATPRTSPRKKRRERHRRTHDAPRRLRREPAAAQAHRGGLRLDEGRSAACASCATAAWPRSRRSSPSPARPTTWCGCERLLAEPSST